jgi:Mitochondrial carrier protein
MAEATAVPKKKKGNPLSALAAGCIAGGIEATAVWPMEYIKVRRSSTNFVRKHSIYEYIC